MRLIDADALENRVRPVKNFDNPESLVVVLGAIRCQPTIDAVPVVRCGECKNWERHVHDRGDDSRCSFHNREIGRDGYCAWGQLKSDLSLGTDNSPHVELEPIVGEYNRYHGELDVRNGKLTIYGSDRCVCCGEIIPEGRQVCPSCERKANER